MKIRLCIIGEEDTVNQIKTVVTEFTDTIVAYYFVYSNRDKQAKLVSKFVSRASSQKAPVLIVRRATDELAIDLK